jgi:hypothetical protein
MSRVFIFLSLLEGGIEERSFVLRHVVVLNYYMPEVFLNSAARVHGVWSLHLIDFSK